jgi:hypothetical protein
MTVPLSEAVARRSPLGERERRAMGVLWAEIMFMGERVRVSKRRTSPVCWRGEVGDEGVWVGCWKVGEVEFGWGKTR